MAYKRNLQSAIIQKKTILSLPQRTKCQPEKFPRESPKVSFSDSVMTVRLLTILETQRMIRVTIKEDDEIELNLPIPNPIYVRKVEEKANFSDLYMKEMDQLREKVNQMTRIMKKMKKKKRSDKKKDQKKKHRKRLNSKK